MCIDLHNSIYDFFNDGDHLKLEHYIKMHEPFLRELALRDEIMRTILPLPTLLRSHDGFHLQQTL